MTALLLLFSLCSCVTVNVNLPESAVQQASDDYVKELYKEKEKGKVAPSPAPSIKASLTLFESEVLAAEVVLRVDSAKTKSIQQKQAARLDEVSAQKRGGVLGENNEGLVELRNKEKIKPLLLKKLEKLVADENEDRMDLYQEVLKQNSVSKNNLKTVQKSFSRSFQDLSPEGTWIQGEDGQWSQKP